MFGRKMEPHHEKVTAHAELDSEEARRVDVLSRQDCFILNQEFIQESMCNPR